MTTWIPYVGDQPSWLLANGNIATSPDLEATGSMRRFRLADNPDVAVWKKELPETVLTAVKKAAELEDTQIVSCLGVSGQLRQEFLDKTEVDIDSREMGEARFHMSGEYNDAVSRAMWHFKHPSMPFHMVLEATLRTHYRSQVYTEWAIYTNTVYGTHQDVPAEDPVLVHRVHHEAGTKNLVVSHYQEYAEDTTSMHEWLLDNQPEWLRELSNIDIPDRYGKPRTAVEAMLSIVCLMDDYSEIDFPIATTREFFPLQFVKSNVTPEFIANLEDYCDGAPVALELKEHFDAIRTILSHRGITVGQFGEDEISAALAGDQRLLDVRIEENGVYRGDTQHAVFLNMLTGIVHVSCSLREQGDSQDWEVALLKAELAGQKDEFLAYWKNHTSDTLADQIRERLSN